VVQSAGLLAYEVLVLVWVVAFLGEEVEARVG
jgi:hypothetical protein